MQVSVVIGKAEKILQDESNGRWPAADNLGWFNSARRLLLLVRPDAKTTRGLITLVDGPHQTLPTGGLRLIKLVRNENGRAVTLISEDQLTSHDPNWYQATARDTTKHYIFDPLEPKGFDIYPPGVAGKKVMGVWSTLPADATAETDDIGVDDIYEMPLVHLVCHFAYLVDSEDTANERLADKHLQTAILQLTGKANADEAGNPATSQPHKMRPQVR
jgi:hypothetical protein